jgi:hypothetical protein
MKPDQKSFSDITHNTTTRSSGRISSHPENCWIIFVLGSQISHVGSVVLVGLRVDVLTKTSHYNLDRENKERERRGEEKRERSTTTATRSPAKESQTLSGDWVNLYRVCLQIFLCHSGCHYKTKLDNPACLESDMISSLVGSGLLAGLRVAPLTEISLDSEAGERVDKTKEDKTREEREN